ncbi:acetyl-CoA C-acyltransferase [Actinoplanes sp. KI2]|uniref:thiolase family protein n=1 Tax=Actinoplanes sp. KI2 TaxID=2983315 RepID=UPI0021D5F16C|nr:beta-ketoacyl synthase N-terminal-like domain-containing protein [Actinoplanes sp. KI2]MCU7725284.1 acetyl-CoA C-acyltransferase [Actinoplanes sp. KI2]
MRDAVIVAATRSPIGRGGRGSLSGVRLADLVAGVVRAALDQVPELGLAGIDDLYVGSAFGRPDTALQVAARLGLHVGPTALVSGLCTSSMQTMRMAVHAIRAGEGDAYISAGADSATQATPTARSCPARHRRLRRAIVRPSDRREALRQAAEQTGVGHRISHYEQDEFRVRSHLLAEHAVKNGFYRREIMPVQVPGGAVVTLDDSPIGGADYETMRTRPIEGRLHDGAAATVIVSDVYAQELGLRPLARVIGTAVSGAPAASQGAAVVEAARRALFHAGLCVADVDLWEIDEASAADTVAAYRTLDIKVDRVNVHGGALALGRPDGMAGARLIATLLNGLRSTDLQVGLAAVSAPNRQAMALVVERLS